MKSLNLINNILKILDNKFLYALIITTFSMLIGVIEALYQTNDDQAMRLLIEGNIFGLTKPSEYVLFLNVFYSRFLTYLYTEYPNIIWYDILFYAFIFISGYALSFTLFVKNNNPVLKIITSTFLIISIWSVSHYLQFTVIAGFLSVAAVCLYNNKKEGQNNYITDFIIILLIILSSLIRYEMMLLTIFSGGIFTLIFLRNKISWQKIVSTLPIIIAVIIASSLHWWHLEEYKKITTPFNPIEYNDIKSQMLDKSLLNQESANAFGDISKYYQQNVLPLLDKLKISENDFSLLTNWGFTGRDFFKIENMKKYSDTLSPTLQGTPQNRLLLYKIYFSKYYNYMYPALVLLLLMCFNINNQKRKKIALAIASQIALLFVLILFMKPFPLRVLIPLYLLEISLCLMFINEERLALSAKNFKISKNLNIVQLVITTPKKHYNIPLLKFLVFAFLLFSFYMPYTNFPHRDKTTHKTINHIETILNKNVLYHVDFAFFNSSVIPFHKTRDFLNKTIGLGWTVATPAFQNKIQEDYYKLLASNKILILARHKEYQWPYDSYEQYMKEHLGLNCKIIWSDIHRFISLGKYKCIPISPKKTQAKK